MSIPEEDAEELAEATMLNRSIAISAAKEIAARGDGLAGMLAELENVAAPFFLGVDADVDDSDMDVYP